MFWSEKFLKKQREIWMKSIVRAEYTMDGRPYPATIVEKRIEGDKLLIDLVITQGNGRAQNRITEIRLYDDNNDVAGKSAENTVKLSEQGLYTAIEITLKEVQS